MIRESIEQLAALEAPPNPFPGLRPFEFHENYLFFGRDGQSERLIEKLRRTRFVAVVGASGSGKSSLVRAGLLPTLYGGLMPGAGSAWRVALMRPGNDPLGNLAQALAGRDAFGVAGEADQRLHSALIEATLRRGDLGLVESTRQAQLPARTNLLVVADQFEELFRVEAGVAQPHASNEQADDKTAFVKLLLAAARQRELNIYVALTMRSDYLGDCTQFQDLPEAINESQYLIPRLTRDERRAAIEGPIAVGGGTITPRLVNRLLNEVGDNPDQLPILQHALLRTWDKWEEERRGDGATGRQGDGASGKLDDDPRSSSLEPQASSLDPQSAGLDPQTHALDLRHYEATGGMAEALSRHADEAYDELPDARSRVVAEKLFKCLTERGVYNREVRHPRTLRECCLITEASEPEVSAVIEVFRRAGRSFLMPPAETPLAGDALIDISHESLIRNWQRLKAWVEAEVRSARIFRRLAETATLYYQGEAGLVRDPELQVALDWQEREQPNENWAQRYPGNFAEALSFLQESRQAHAAQLAQAEAAQKNELKRKRTALLLRVVLVVIPLLLALLVYADWQRRQARAQEASAKSERDRAVRVDRANTNIVGLLYELLYDEDDPNGTLRRLKEAEEYYQQSQNTAGVGVAQASLGEAHFRAEDFSAAREHYEQALASLEKEFGHDHIYVARTHAQLGQTLAKLAERGESTYADAEHQFKKALSMQQQILGQESDAVANTLNGLAEVYQKMGPEHYQQAETLFDQARAIHRNPQVYEEKHQQFAVDLNYLATLRKDQERYAEAADLYRQALKLLDQLIGDDSSQAAQPLKARYLYRFRADVAANLANVLTLNERYAEAEPLYQQVLRYNEELFKLKGAKLQALKEQTLAQQKSAQAALPFKQAEALAPSLFRLGTLYRSWGKYAQAMPYLRQALAQHELLVQAGQAGGSERAVADDLYNLGICARKLGQFAEAERYLNRALGYYEEVGNQRATARALYALALGAYEQKKLAAAVGYYEGALATQQRIEFDGDDQAKLERLAALRQKQ